MKTTHSIAISRRPWILVLWISCWSYVNSQIPQVDNVRLLAPLYSSANNIVRGQVEVYAKDVREWRIACSSEQIMEDTQSFFGSLLCQALGYDTNRDIEWGNRGIRNTRSVEFTQCSDNAATINHCTNITRNTGNCGVRRFIYIVCADLTLGTLVPSQVIECQRSGRFSVSPGSNATALFQRRQIPSICSTVFDVQPNNYLQLENLNLITAANHSPASCDNVNHVIARQMFPNSTSIESKLCRSSDILKVTSMTSSLNLTYVKMPGEEGIQQLTATLRAKPQLAVTCQLPTITVEIITERLTATRVDQWAVYIGSSENEDVGAECWYTSEMANNTSGEFKFSFPASACNTVRTFNRTHNSLKLTNDLLLIGSEIDDVIERTQEFQLPIECEMKITSEFASVTVDPVAPQFDEVFEEAFTVNHRINIYRDTTFATPMQQISFVGNQVKQFYARLEPSVADGSAPQTSDPRFYFQQCVAQREHSNDDILLIRDRMPVSGVDLLPQLLPAFRIDVNRILQFLRNQNYRIVCTVGTCPASSKQCPET